VMVHAPARAHLGGKSVHVVDESRPGNVGAFIGATVAGVDDANLRIVEVGLKPGGRNHRLDAGHGGKRKDMEHVYLLAPLDGRQVRKVHGGVFTSSEHATITMRLRRARTGY